MDADKIFFTADTHFGHRAMVERFGRPWNTVDEMDEAMIEIWNERVPHDGHVYHLGDVSFRNAADTVGILARLNGRHLILVEGNHDRGMSGAAKGFFAEMHNLREIKVEGQRIVLCHFPLESWHQMQYGAWHLHGHSHGNMRTFGKRLDVGVDVHGYGPVSFRDVAEIMFDRKVEASDHHQPKVDAIEIMA